MPGTGADGGEAAFRGIGLPEVVITLANPPALDRACAAQAAGVVATGADGGEIARGGITLPVAVASPALNCACLAQAAGVPGTGADGGEIAH